MNNWSFKCAIALAFFVVAMFAFTAGVVYERGTSPHCTTYKKIPFNAENLK